jgi:hypothetical protein
MALSFTTVQDAYKVLHNIKMTALPELDIRSWPEDTARWGWEKTLNPPENVLLGYDKKYDDGWEQLIFYVNSPTEKLKQAFREHNTIKGNSSICKPMADGSLTWVFGWF